MIQALAKAGLELAEIRDFLEQRSLSLAELLDGQITLLDKQLRSPPGYKAGSLPRFWQKVTTALFARSDAKSAR